MTMTGGGSGTAEAARARRASAASYSSCWCSCNWCQVTSPKRTRLLELKHRVSDMYWIDWLYRYLRGGVFHFFNVKQEEKREKVKRDQKDSICSQKPKGVQTDKLFWQFKIFITITKSKGNTLLLSNIFSSFWYVKSGIDDVYTHTLFKRIHFSCIQFMLMLPLSHTKWYNITLKKIWRFFNACRSWWKNGQNYIFFFSL